MSDIAGTTRDVIEAPVSLGGIPMILTDTAGVRDDSGDEIEAIGIARAQAAFERADIVLWLGDEGQGPVHPELIEISSKADVKTDPAKSNGLPVSAKSGAGVDDLILAITEGAARLLPPEGSVAINKRQRAALSDMAAALGDAAEAQDPLIVGELLRQARLAVDALTGRTHTEDMLDVLFSRFCIGK